MLGINSKMSDPLRGSIARSGPVLSQAGLSAVAKYAGTSWSEHQTFMLKTAAAVTAGLCLLFQIGHFAEHAFQFGVWILGDMSNICGRDTPWMSPWATKLVEGIGRF